MRPPVLGIPFASIMSGIFGRGFKPVILRRANAAARVPGMLSAGFAYASETTWTCRGIVETYSATEIAEGLATMDERRVVILGGTLPDGIDPRVNDRVDVDGATYSLVQLDARDAAGASFVFRAKPGAAWIATPIVTHLLNSDGSGMLCSDASGVELYETEPTTMLSSDGSWAVTSDSARVATAG